MTIAFIEHIVLDDKNVARIAGTRFRVSQIAQEHIDWAWSADAIKRQHESLSLAQIHSALAYYFDHREAIEQEIEESDRLAAEYQKKFPSPLSRPDLQAKIAELRALLTKELE